MATDISYLQQMYRRTNHGNFPERLGLSLAKESDVRYGENPHQQGAIYSLACMGQTYAGRIAELIDLLYVRSDGKGKGGLSGTNTMDVSRAINVLKYFAEIPACVIMKHNIVSGFAKNGSRSLAELFITARDCDARSNYGGTAVFTRPLDRDTAEALFTGPFVDVLAAPDYDQGVVGLIEGKSGNMRIAQFSNLGQLPKFEGDDTMGLLSLKEMPGGRYLVQSPFLTRVKSADDLIADAMIRDEKGIEHIVALSRPESLDDAVTAWYLNITGARSNGVVAVRNGVLVSCGSGQVERVGAVEQMIVKGIQKAMDREGIKYDPLKGILGYESLQDNPFVGASCSSDGFFPFADSISLLGRVGVGTVIQPFGSIRDADVIDEINLQRMAALCTGERGFTHF